MGNKADMQRDYYGDLEMAPTTDINEIKKQFRKLALKYHPDRNPGHEAEVNSKFQTIQSAHEVLIDPEQKAKYDAARSRTTRYPTASGVKGNPWQNAADPFPRPPRRTASTRHNASGGAARWNNFTPGNPPTAKKPAADDQEARRSRWHAFESMRSSSSGKSAYAQTQANRESEPKSATSRPVPQTPFQKQRAEASFGNRKSGYYPRSPERADEPSARSKSYTSSRYSDVPGETSDGPRKTRAPNHADLKAKFQEAFLDERQSTPYHTTGGEKLNPFDGIPPVHTKSTRDRGRRQGSPTGRHRSSSLPRHGDEDETPGLRVPSADGRPRTAGAAGSSHNGTFSSRAEARDTSTSSAEGYESERRAPDTNHTPTANGGPSMYAAPGSPPFSAYRDFLYPAGKTSYSKTSTAIYYQCGCGSVCFFNEDTPANVSSKSSPSGSNLSEPSYLNSFDHKMHELLSSLINSGSVGRPISGKGIAGRKRASSHFDAYTHSSHADKKMPTSFSFPVTDETFEPSAPNHPPFTRGSADDINTRFVNSDRTDSWQFSAGGPAPNPASRPRAHSSSRLGRQSPTKRPTLRRTEKHAEEPPAIPETGSGAAFDADHWAGKLGPQNFVPNQTHPSQSSPTRPARLNSRKARTVRPTMGNAGMVNEDTTSSSEEGEAQVRQRFSPNAMDIDTPPAEPAEPAEHKTPTPPNNGPRAVPVEPSRADWRPGQHVNGVNTAAPKEAAGAKAFQANAKGSEDSEEFRTNFADIRNVPPFAHSGGGLGSFGDMKENLPFDSKPEPQVPIDIPVPPPELVFPRPPMAPRPPPALAVPGLKPSANSWNKYVDDFETYIRVWDEFDAKVSAHFATRADQVAGTRRAKGFGFLGAAGDGGCSEYLYWVHQDNEIRSKWYIAGREHEQRVKEFMAYRHQMK